MHTCAEMNKSQHRKKNPNKNYRCCNIILTGITRTNNIANRNQKGVHAHRILRLNFSTFYRYIFSRLSSVNQRNLFVNVEDDTRQKNTKRKLYLDSIEFRKVYHLRFFSVFHFKSPQIFLFYFYCFVCAENRCVAAKIVLVSCAKSNLSWKRHIWTVNFFPFFAKPDRVSEKMFVLVVFCFVLRFWPVLSRVL